MYNRSKYDVLADEYNGLYRNIFLCYIKVLIAKIKVNNGKITKDNIRDEIMKIFDGLMPYIIKMSHIGYENYKDTEKLNWDDILGYVSMCGESSTDFENSYFANVNNYVRFLLFLALHERDSVSFSLNNRYIVLKLYNGYSLEETDLDEKELLCFCNKFNDKSKSLLDKIISKDFDFRSLTKEERELLDNFHDRYMRESIYPKVDVMYESRERIMRESKSLGLKK